MIWSSRILIISIIDAFTLIMHRLLANVFCCSNISNFLQIKIKPLKQILKFDSKFYYYIIYLNSTIETRIKVLLKNLIKSRLNYKYDYKR